MADKTIDTLIPDIEQMLRDIIEGGNITLPPEVLAEFGTSVAVKLDKMLQGRTKKRPPKTLYMSEYGKPCKRQLWYAVHGFPPEPMEPSTLIKFLYGDILEELVLLLARVAGHEVSDEQKECEIKLPKGWVLRGRLDAKIDGTLIDVKSASTSSFKKFKDGSLFNSDSFGYIGQIDGYSAAEGVLNGGFVAIDKQLGHLTYLPVRELPHEILWDHNAKTLVNAMESAFPPNRAYTHIPMGSTGNMQLCTSCSYCQFKHKCWDNANDGNGLRTFIYSHGPVYLTEVRNTPKVKELA